MKLSLDALAVLDAIDRRRSFAAAASELHRVPSAVTYQVQKLEDDLGVLLFDRRGHRALPTPAAVELLASGRRLLAAAAEAEHRVRQVATGWEPEIRVAVDSMLPFALVWPLCARFDEDCRARQASHTRLRLSTEVLGGAFDALVGDRADIVIGAAGDPPPGEGLRLRPLADVELVFAVAPSHPLATAPEPLSTELLARHRVVVAADSSRRLPPRTIGLVDGQDTLTVPDLGAKLAAQAAGLGCGFLPVHLAAPALREGTLVARRVEEPRPPVRLSVAWRGTRPGKALAWWIDAASRSGLGEALARGGRAPSTAKPAGSGEKTAVLPARARTRRR